MTFQIVHAGLTDVGRARAGNEDAWAADPGGGPDPVGLYVVADGMGGHAAGEVAARMVVDRLPVLLRRRLAARPPASGKGLARRVKAAVVRLSRQVLDRSRSARAFRGMGATVVAAVVRGTDAVVVHLGDSRAYLFRDGRLRQLTKDHSFVQALVDLGQITEAEAETHPDRNRITAGVGMDADPTPVARRVRLRTGDRLLLCSDGLSGMVSAGELADLLGRSADPAAVCAALVAAANAAGGLDNITALVIDARAGDEDVAASEPLGSGAGPP